MEIGLESVYYDVDGNSLHRNSSDKGLVLHSRSERITDEVCTSLQSKIRDHFVLKESPSFKATVKVNKMDPLEKEYSSNDESSYNRNITMSYLKILNVPTRSDIDFSASEPDKKHLIIDYIDNVSYDIEPLKRNRAGKPGEGLVVDDEKVKLTEVEKLYQAIKAIHVHLNVSEINISFSGKIKLLAFY